MLPVVFHAWSQPNATGLSHIESRKANKCVLSFFAVFFLVFMAVLLACRNGRTPSRRTQDWPSSSWSMKAGRSPRLRLGGFSSPLSCPSHWWRSGPIAHWAPRDSCPDGVAVQGSAQQSMIWESGEALGVLGGAVSSRLHSIPAHPTGIRGGEQRG